MEMLQGYHHLSLTFERILDILKATVVLNDTKMVDTYPLFTHGRYTGPT